MEIIASSPLVLLFKYFFLAILLIYIVFAVVVVKQVRIMNKTLDVGIETQIAILAYLHLIFAVFIFLTALFVL
jgi:hypothetical protein